MLLALINGGLVCGWGLALGRWVYGWLGKPEGGQSPLVWLCLGWALQSGLAAAWSLVAPVNPAVMAVLWTLLALYAGWHQGQFWRARWAAWRQGLAPGRWYLWLGLALILIAALGLAARPGKIFDEGLYYTQSIRWVQQYGLVPGLGNLHTRLGFNSHWHVLQAALAWPGAQQHDLNAQLWLLMSFSGLWHAGRVLRRPRASLSLFWVLLLLLSPLWFNLLTAPSADFALAVLTWLLAWLYLRRASAKLLWILALWALTIKLSGALLLLFPLARWWQSGTKRWQQLPWLAPVGLVILLPWLLRNIGLTGYLIYPVWETALGLDWQVPTAWAAQDIEAIRSWARLPGGTAYWETLTQPVSVWLPNWWAVQSLEQQSGISTALGIMLWTLGRMIFRGKKPGRWEGALLLLFVNGLFWFVQAPDPRFGLGAIWGLVLVGLAPYLGVRHRIAKAGLIGLLLLTQAMMLRGWDDSLKHGLQSAPFHRPEVKSLPVVGGTIWLSEEPDGCFDAGLPCTHVRPKGLQWRGPALKNGFRVLPAGSTDDR